ncbi:MAG: hypothetical protein US60_C0042G0018 [Microgenomates group bacterium GW2011_GWC1_37_8]|uniref:Response regulator receiver domain protein n=2 Tax=Candidatus Woeseibacteriota TaxID=1752722 RepID=A0A0G0NGA8_9BACT|nr:MAG: hypothetical protein US60_C0042G0018 [Microgenomates group bacterium GW2011_GWC1_37_8]KKQ84939.1 MAG: Response regulator receiver domain protein [Candidatus Woesebacteria bacterium GW2011_GWB1_38_8]OGM20970.1 MAG: hypothetical protein A2863_03695 [Candidatus Woesebacteria bacterium RIFCSPHIGHO2_01_FULL_38_9b]
MISKKILIIEDEEAVLDILDKKLREEGFETVTSRDGKEGLEIALREKPDLVLLDLILPTMDGLTLLDKLRADVAGKNLSVVILTNLDNAEKIEEGRKKGVYDYLVKTDWTLEDVIKRVKQVLNEK